MCSAEHHNRETKVLNVAQLPLGEIVFTPPSMVASQEDRSSLKLKLDIHPGPKNV
jgi:hypothetical protein